jgi:hypothetical protein
MLQVSANGTDWVVATGSNKVWVTADDAVTLVTGRGNLTARVIDTAGNVTALPLSNNGCTFDTSASSIPTVYGNAIICQYARIIANSHSMRPCWQICHCCVDGYF